MITRKELDRLDEKYPNEKIDLVNNTNLRTLAKYTSGSRLVMFDGQSEQRLTIENGEIPLVFTGYENAFGDYADSYVKAKSNLKIINVISKFPTQPRDIYVYVVQDMLTGVYDVIEVKHYEKLSETHGYMKPTVPCDYKVPGNIIMKDEVISKSPSHDDEGNYMVGKNLNIAYINLLEVCSDGILISDRLIKDKVIKFYQIDKHTILVNKNHVLDNLYGDNVNHKGFPDIGEEINNNILCVRRQINLSNAASELTTNALKRMYESDEPVYAKGKVIDIDVFINDPEESLNNSHRNQITMYWFAQQEYYNNIKKALAPIINNKNNNYTFKLKFLYEKAKNYCEPEMKFSGPNGIFEYALVEITTCKETYLSEGCKMVNRFSAKSVICHIMPHEYMPRDRWGNVADVVMSPAGVVNRANVGQNYAHELNFIADGVRRLMVKETDVNKQFALMFEFLQIVNMDYAMSMKRNYESLNDFYKAEMVFSAISKGIPIRQPPFHDTVTLEELDWAYTKFGVKPDRIRIKKRMKRRGNFLPSQNQYPDNYYTIDFDKHGNIETQYFTPYNVDSFEEIEGADEYVCGDIYVPTSDNKDVSKLKYDKKQKMLVSKVRETPDIFELDKHGCDDENTYVYDDEEDEDMVIRDFLSVEPVIIAKEYMMVLKQMADNKLSARNVGTCSPLGIPNKTNKSEIKTPLSSTPINIGEMELYCLYARNDVDIVNRWLATITSNPALRSRLFNMLLFDDPLQLHNLDISEDEMFKSIPPKELEALLFCTGYDILYEKDGNDIYSPFDGLDYTAEEMLEVVKETFKIKDIE